MKYFLKMSFYIYLENVTKYKKREFSSEGKWVLETCYEVIKGAKN